MDLLDPRVPLELYDPSWKIYSRNPVRPPHYISSEAMVQNSMIAEGCSVYGTIDFSVLFAGVTVEEGAVVRDSIVMPGATIKAGAVVEYSIIGENTVIGERAMVGARPEQIEDKDTWGLSVIGPDVEIKEGEIIPPKAMVEA